MTAKAFRLATLIALAVPASLAMVTAAAVPIQDYSFTSGLTTVAHAVTLRPGDRITSTLPDTEPMPIVVALKLRNPGQLRQLVAAHELVTQAQIKAEFAPTASQAQAVAQYLTRMGYTQVRIAPNNLVITAEGNAGTASAAFATTFARVTTKSGRKAFANTQAAHIPVALQGSVLSVMGLQSVHRVRSYALRLQSTTGASISSHDPTQFSSIYGGTGVPTAAGVTVGIISEGDLSQTLADLNTFTANHGLPTVTTQIVNTGGTSTDTSGVMEWDLDSQTIVGMSGGRVGRIIFYDEPSLLNSDLVANFNTIVMDNVAKVINVSLGECELGAEQDGSAAALDQILQVAVAQGQTFSVATGDHGADECGNGGITPSWPASSPYVVAVAGTLLNASTTTWDGETVWNNLPGFGATGGSPSTFEPKPSWQDAMVPGSTRGVADVAFDASPFSGARLVYYGGSAVVGGTSLATPIFTGSWARVLATKGLGVGFAAPLLYQLPAVDFHDITVGNNAGENAGVGYDFASGRGSLILDSAIGHIGGSLGGAPPVASFNVNVLGLAAYCKDQSTDSNGTIVAHAWTFGDGGRSTAVNPEHLYAQAGTYNITETVTDNAGLTASKTETITVGR